MKHQNIQTNAISDSTGTTVPSAGANGYLGPIALQTGVDFVNSEVIAVSGDVAYLNENATLSINSLPAINNGFTFVTDGTIEVVPVSAGNILLRLYVAIDVTSLSVSPSTAEVGQVISSATLNWAINKTETSQSLNNSIGSITNGQRSYVHSTSISSNRTYTLTASDGTTSDNASATLTYMSRRFYGTTPTATNLTESDVEAGTNELSTSRNKSITYSAGGNYIFFAYPTSFGLATVKDENNLVVADWRNGGVQTTSPYTISVTNGYGYTQNYYVYHSYNPYAGSVTFSWS